MRGPVAHSGEKNGIPFQISMSASRSAVAAGGLAQGGPGEHHVPARFADHLVAVALPRGPGGPGRRTCASRPRCPPRPSERPRWRHGPRSLRPRRRRDRATRACGCASTGGRGDVAELLAGLGRVGGEEAHRGGRGGAGRLISGCSGALARRLRHGVSLPHGPCWPRATALRPGPINDTVRPAAGERSGMEVSV